MVRISSSSSSIRLYSSTIWVRVGVKAKVRVKVSSRCVVGVYTSPNKTTITQNINKFAHYMRNQKRAESKQIGVDWS